LIISALKNTGKDFLGEKEIFCRESFTAALMAISTGDIQTTSKDTSASR
jgi:hypothetical protein